MRNLEWGDDQDWPGKDEHIVLEINEENKRWTSISLTHEHIASLRNYNIDLNALASNTILDEAKLAIKKDVCKSAFSYNITGTESHEVSDKDSLFSLLKTFKSGFLITNVQVATLLQDTREMTLLPTSAQITSTGGMLYQIGSFKGIAVYVDPYMTWGDNRCAIVHNNFYNFLISQDYKVTEYGTMAPKIIQPYYFNQIPVDNTIIEIKSEKPLI